MWKEKKSKGIITHKNHPYLTGGGGLTMTIPVVPEKKIQNFIKGNLYEDENTGGDIMIYLGKEECNFMDHEGFIDLYDSQILEDDIPFIKKAECHVFQELLRDGKLGYTHKFLLSQTQKLEKIKIHFSVDFSKLSTHKVDIQQYEKSSKIILKKLFVKTYYQQDTNKIKLFKSYSRQIGSHKFSLSYISQNGNSFINKKDLHMFNTNERLLDVLNTTPKAESDFYVFRGIRTPRYAYECEKIISKEITEEKMFGSISTTILSSFAFDWMTDKQCCIYLIKVPKEENYLILDDVFNDELELNDKSQYEVTLAPGKIIFRDINQITINGSKVAFFVCDYKSFTSEEFASGFDKAIYNIKDDPVTEFAGEYKEFKSEKHHKIYYLNTVTNKTSWGLPTYEDGKTLLPIGWERVTSTEKKPGFSYYYNNENGNVQWEDPKINFFSPTADVTPVGPGIPIEFIHLVSEIKPIPPEDCMQNERWKIGKFVNQGRQGSIYLTTNDKENYVIKVQVANNDFFQEVRALQDLQDTNYVVKIFAAWTCKGSGYIVMEQVNPFSYGNSYGIDDCTLWKEVGKILNVISEYGWLQVDVRKENVAITNEGKIILIDFGYAVKKTKDGNETYPEHKLSVNFPNITWDQLKINQDFTYQKYFNPCAQSHNTECTPDKQKILQESKEKWESQKFDPPLKGHRKFFLR